MDLHHLAPASSMLFCASDYSGFPVYPRRHLIRSSQRKTINYRQLIVMIEIGGAWMQPQKSMGIRGESCSPNYGRKRICLWDQFRVIRKHCRN